MQKYRRVTYEDRCHISALLQANNSVSKVAEALGFHKSTIYRELKRNSVKNIYSCEKATKLAAKRYTKCRRKKLISKELKEELLAYLSFGWSPEQLSGRLFRERKTKISYQTIYRSLSNQKIDRKFLRRFNKRGAGRTIQKRHQNKNKTFIQHRPSIVEQRKRIGDWERDGMYGANRKQLLILTDRKSRYTRIKKIEKGNATLVKEVTIKTLSEIGKRVYTVTNDNGTEFNNNASMPFRVYHCEPHKPHQRGSVENTIGLLRQYIKRKTDLDKLTKEDLKVIENKINFRPKKCLDFKTPFEVFYDKKVALVM